MEAFDVLRIAGCETPTRAEAQQFELAEAQKTELQTMEKEMDQWRQDRQSELDR